MKMILLGVTAVLALLLVISIVRLRRQIGSRERELSSVFDIVFSRHVIQILVSAVAVGMWWYFCYSDTHIKQQLHLGEYYPFSLSMPESRYITWMVTAWGIYFAILAFYPKRHRRFSSYRRFFREL